MKAVTLSATLAPWLLGMGLVVGSAAQAAVNVTHTLAAGPSSDVVMAKLSFDLGTDYPFTSLDFHVEYNPVNLAFDAGLSTVTVEGATYGYAQFLAAWAAGMNEQDDLQVNSDTGNGLYSLAAYVVNPVAVTGPVEVDIALRLAPAFTSGTTSVFYSGQIAGDLDESQFSGDFSISAVPEPETWLLWLGGLSLVLARQARQRRPS